MLASLTRTPRAILILVLAALFGVPDQNGLAQLLDSDSLPEPVAVEPPPPSPVVDEPAPKKKPGFWARLFGRKPVAEVRPPIEEPEPPA